MSGPAASNSGGTDRRRLARRSGSFLAGIGLTLFVLFVLVALVSYHQSDPSPNTSAGGPPLNWMGGAGAWTADLLLMAAGPPVALFLPILLIIGLRLARGTEPGRWLRALIITFCGVALVGLAGGLFAGGEVWGLPAGWGGGIGLALARLVDAGSQAARRRRASSPRSGSRSSPSPRSPASRSPFSASASPPRKGAGSPSAACAAQAPGTRTTCRSRPAGRRARRSSPRRNRAARSSPSRRRPQAGGRRPLRERQPSLALGDAYTLPSVDLLAPPPPRVNVAIDKAALERNARLLESVLEDFSVKGEIVEVRPGPVVTMYELEPASGIKASRVIQLADDIARNMSALSARVATIPGRSVIGIELPNAKRELVTLSELVSSPAFEDQVAQLPIILGKNIAGDPVVADLAPMPHLLVAGTTGSGKSVGLNCMILSLLYRLTPEQCKMILIDPKMLELSVYDDIPHLLAPVVTEPAKAIRALKWTVEQMEERYRMMASVGVRQLSSFNAKVREAKMKGQPLGRRVQTGYDPETGQPRYEMEELDYEVLPQVVVVVDELADLMMTAGKEVEFLIQRLAQKARAAGIHLIMATQRPSVDVITGVIKANLPTRISFSVTSKIDSRTILGEQGAEQLLGKGDMLYMPGGKQIARVHGPLVSDEEVRAVADFWRAQGRPDYVQAVTEEPEDGGYMFEGQPIGEDDAETQLFRKAVQVVAESQKASTSYLQRQLRVGYNNAARLIERMEKEGVVSAPDHVGRREVLVDPEGRPLV